MSEKKHEWALWYTAVKDGKSYFLSCVTFGKDLEEAKNSAVESLKLKRSECVFWDCILLK